MKKIAVVTDSNSGITQEEAQKMGIHVLPMPFTIDGNEYFEGINLTQEEFYEKLKGDADIATSQPSPHAILKLWDELLKEYDEIVQIPMSSGLSGSCQTAAALAADYEDRVFVVNNHRISVTQRRSVDTALAMVKDGKSGQEIKDFRSHLKIPEKRRPSDPGSSGYRDHAPSEAGADHPGREAGQLRQGPHHAPGQAADD